MTKMMITTTTTNKHGTERIVVAMMRVSSNTLPWIRLWFGYAVTDNIHLTSTNTECPM
jgi:hypothetical protein